MSTPDFTGGKPDPMLHLIRRRVRGAQSLFQHSAFSGLVETAIEREMVPEEISRPLDTTRQPENVCDRDSSACCVKS